MFKKLLFNFFLITKKYIIYYW